MLATLSPAHINFNETLGTLQYASRAKSIKVNAKKNEESSQVSKLNDEISALKKKLMEQTDITGDDPGEKSEIAAKYEKQIQEIDAIRMQTWEDKVKLSKKHEMERKKMAKEKALSDKKIQEEKMKKWKLFKEKGDIGLAIQACYDMGLGSNEWIEQVSIIQSMEVRTIQPLSFILI